ncbi:DTW domain-containing protein [Massilia sp. PAMC28688]|uniref:tRNA-uridine aminocarboxypropyltransferase n=1 Tax=Massilia sp. PAMC28688 TaxID=2861283 RepID=UPI001C626E4E|nr:tRNA-uridine aminocarboxypropyltransferase [Massilia sp. PAMC28688]QYF92338.1 DTW domain-containing protein [Massilia sp. PAMC28688]
MSRRAHCPRCTRPLSACICRWITPVHSAAPLLILQHPLEVNNAKGSARLLQLSVDQAALAVGESFDPQALAAMLSEGGRLPVLLYPDLPGERELGLPAPPACEPAQMADPARVRLVILDGTWRKSRKMLYLNPALQALPRLALAAVPATHYTIRKAHAPHQLSTLEAACHALGQLHGDDTAFLPLLQAFDDFVAHFHATSGKLALSARHGLANRA